MTFLTALVRILQLKNRLIARGAAAAVLLAMATTASADTESPYRQITPSADGIGKQYQGREIAQVMGWQGAPWLDRSSRERQERTDLLVPLLSIKPGMAVADVGAGTGYFSRRLADAVGPKGAVYAVDVQPEMLRMLQALAKTPGMERIKPVLGTVDDARLPMQSIDLALMVDVYHELEFPREVLASLVRALKPDGRIVFVEYRAEDERVPIKPLHKMSQAQVRREAEPLGLKLQSAPDPLPWQHVMIFAKASRP